MAKEAKVKPRYGAGAPLPMEFYSRDSRIVAPELLNKVLAVADGRSGRIVEVEAYCGALDPAAHSYRGRTARNATMFERPGLLYVYFTYGMHWCCNAVCGGDICGNAVLIRALEPLSGVDAMREARGGMRDERLLCSGPARLSQALGITGRDDGTDLVSGAGGIMISDDGVPPPAGPALSRRIGITRGVERLWRWHVPGNPHVSRSPARAQKERAC